MSVFVDTGLFYALQNERATNHDAATAALSAAFDGRYGPVYTSDYVYDETVTLVRSRTGRYEEAKTVGDRIRGTSGYPDVIDLLFLSEPGFDAARDVFEDYRDHPLSFTDAATVALMDAHDIDRVLAFDDDFDGVVDRLDPAEVA